MIWSGAKKRLARKFDVELGSPKRRIIWGKPITTEQIVAYANSYKSKTLDEIKEIAGVRHD